jgi:hypothetical protein
MGITKAKVDNFLRDIEHKYQESSTDLFKTFRAKVKTPKSPLPATLLTTLGEIRNPQDIRTTWNTRYNLTQIECGTDEDKQFRKQIETFVTRYRTENTRTPEDEKYQQVFSVNQTKHILVELESNKSPADDNILNEMMKRASAKTVTAINLLCNILHMAEVITKHWKLQSIVPAYKRDDKHVCTNYRPIGSTSHLYKVYERHELPLLEHAAQLPPEQCGARKLFGSHTLLRRLQILQQYCRQNQINLYLLLIDVKEAFERVWRTGLMFRLYEIGVRGKLWRIIDDMLTDTYARVQTNYGPTPCFKTTMGIVQGAVLSMLLFTIYFTPFSTACKNISPVINGLKFNPQCYVDDGTGIAISVKQADELWKKIQNWCNTWNTILSVKRSASEILKANM